MCCGVHEADLVIRLSHEDADDLLADPNVRPMDITGHPMRGGFTYHPSGFERPPSSGDGWIAPWPSRRACLPRLLRGGLRGEGPEDQSGGRLGRFRARNQEVLVREVTTRIARTGCGNGSRSARHALHADSHTTIEIAGFG
jgi:hypothetical protein